MPDKLGEVSMVFTLNEKKDLTWIISDKFILIVVKPKVCMKLRVYGCVTQT